MCACRIVKEAAPTSACQHFVERNQVAQPRQPHADERPPAAVQRPRGHQYAEITVHAGLVGSLPEPIRLPERVQLGLLFVLLFQQPGSLAERVADFPKGPLNRFLVFGNCGVPVRLGYLVIDLSRSRIEMSKLGTKAGRHTGKQLGRQWCQKWSPGSSR
jgi:hypothetical protein